MFFKKSSQRREETLKCPHPHLEQLTRKGPSSLKPVILRSYNSQDGIFWGAQSPPKNSRDGEGIEYATISGYPRFWSEQNFGVEVQTKLGLCYQLEKHNQDLALNSGEILHNAMHSPSN